MHRLLLLTLTVAAVACSAKTAPPAGSGATFPGAVAATPDPSAGTTTQPTTRVLPPPPPVQANPGAVTGAAVGSSVEDLNDNSPLKPAFFQYDSDTLDEAARGALTANASVLRANPGWVITIEGHCDERGTPEYNLALGERRAAAARDYLVSIGVAADRLQTVSYGKEFPFATGSDESAWSLNRRAHFLLTAK
jgi:peptidoglycan-associated lipoprotein